MAVRRRWRVSVFDPESFVLYGVERFWTRRGANRTAAFHNRFCRGLLVARVEKV